MMASKQADGLDLEQQVWAATETLREAVLRLLQGGDIHPHVIVLALARVTGETGTAAALVSGETVEQVLGQLAAVVLRAGREHQELLQGGGAAGDRPRLILARAGTMLLARRAGPAI
jgi:hypothetical protein